MAQLTERQQQIKALLDEGKTPREIGEILGISENAVYQHRRRITGGGKAKTTTTTTGKRRGRPPKQQPPEVAAPVQRATTKAPSALWPPPADPLDAVQQRRAAIQGVLAESKALADQTAAAAAEAKQAHDEAVASVQVELDRLDTAEAVLTGQLKPKARGKANGKAETPPALKPEDLVVAEQDAAAEAPDAPTEVASQERPGVETVPEFRQEDAFAS